jgi:L-amino acid N-acyltransferase YncA
MKLIPFKVFRLLGNLRRNSRAKSFRLLRQRGETLDDFKIRLAVEADILQLASVHVKAWADTYFMTKNPPSFGIRESQWREAFRNQDGSWFVYVVENKAGTIIGFAHGKTYHSTDLAGYQGELNKIYLLFEYHRMGLGTLLLRKVAEHFIALDIHNMVLFSEATNPTGWFYEAMGAKKLYGKNGGFHGGYAWDDLRELVNEKNR